MVDSDNLVKLLIPYIRPIRDSNFDFPEGFCDIVTAQVWSVYKVPGYEPACGIVDETWHFWLKFGKTNIDFTAHQFPSLMKHVVFVDGFEVILGSDSYLKSIGYILHTKEYCAKQLLAITGSDVLGKVGECSTNLCLLN